MEGAGRSWGTLILQEASLETGTSTEARTSNGIIHLNTPSSSSSRVHWSPDTVDNEGLGKKKSNVCCIFHKEDKGHCQEGGSEDDATRTDGKDDGWNAYEQQPKRNLPNMAWGQAHIKGTREGCLGGVLLKMVAIVQDDVVYGRNLPGTILFSLLLVIDLMSMFDYVLNVRWRQTLYHLPIAIDLIVKAFLLHRPLTPPIKTLCIFASAATALGAAIIYSVFPSMLLSALALLVAVQSAVTAIILFFEHTLIGRLFMPFTRTNSEVVIM